MVQVTPLRTLASSP